MAHAPLLKAQMRHGGKQWANVEQILQLNGQGATLNELQMPPPHHTELDLGSVATAQFATGATTRGHDATNSHVHKGLNFPDNTILV